MIRWRLRLAVIVAAGLVIAPGIGRAEDLKLATMRLGTSWYVFGATFYKLIYDKLPPGSRLEIMAKGGGIANPILVNSGKAQLGLANRATAVWAVDGHPLVYKGRKHENLRALVGGLNSVPISAIVREEYIVRTGNGTLVKIFESNKPVRIVMKPKGSSVPVVADMILDALGTSRDKVREKGGRIIQVSSKQIPSVLRNGQADVYFESTPLGHPTVTEVSLTVPVRFLDLPEVARTKLARMGLTTIEVPKFWKGQDGPTKAVDLGTVIIANRDVSDEIAYLFTKTICENKDALAKAHKAWARFDPSVAWKPENAGIALHPGAERYYRERGWLVK